MGNEFSQGHTKNASEGLLRMVLLEFLGGVLQIRGTSGGGSHKIKYVCMSPPLFVMVISTYLSLDLVFIFLLISRPQ